MPDISDTDRELLAMLAEEASEIVQAVTKILRHDYGSHNPDSDKFENNIEALQHELIDLEAVRHLCLAYGSAALHTSCVRVRLSIDEALARKTRYMHYLPKD